MGEVHSIRARGRRAIPRGVGALGLALVLCGVATPVLAGSQIYSYVDGDGVTHFTNSPRGDRRFRPVTIRTLRPVRNVAPARYEYDLLIDSTAEEVRLPPALVKAVIAAESAFDPQAISRAGAQGLMQLMPTTAEHLGVANPLEPAQNVRGGAEYLRAMIDRYGDLTRAIAAYNAGPEAVDRYGGIPPYRETRDYVERVLTYYRHYHGDFAR